MYIPPLRPELGVLAQESGLDLGGGGLGLNIALLIVSFLLFTFFTSMEAAVLTVSRVRIKHLASQGNRAARAIERIWEREDRFFAFVILGQNLFLILATALATAVAIDVAGQAGWGAAVAIILLTVAAVIFGEMTPKIFAVRAAERYALVVGSLIHFSMLALMPLPVLPEVVPPLSVREALSTAMPWPPLLLTIALVISMRLMANTKPAERSMPSPVLSEAAQLAMTMEEATVLKPSRPLAVDWQSV